MNRTSWTLRVLVSATVTGAVLVNGGVAAAQESPATEPAPVTITLSPEQVTRLCEQRLPKIETRAGRLVERITGGADVRGSAEWLRARAEREREAGRETSAELLEERAQRRESRVAELNQVTEWVANFRDEHCATS